MVGAGSLPPGPPQPQSSQRPGYQGTLVPSNNLWVGSVPPTVTEEDIKDEFTRLYGEVETIQIVRQKSCGFLRLRHFKDAERAQRDGTIKVKGNNLKVNWGHPDPDYRGTRDGLSRQSAEPRSEAKEHYGGSAYTEVHYKNLPVVRIPMKSLPEKPPAKTLWVGNVQHDFTVEMIHKLFNRFGEITNIKMLLEKV